jgi:ABC-type amino acid transport system permease subunit
MTDTILCSLTVTMPRILDRKQTIIGMITPVARASSIWLVRKYDG